MLRPGRIYIHVSTVHAFDDTTQAQNLTNHKHLKRPPLQRCKELDSEIRMREGVLKKSELTIISSDERIAISIGNNTIHMFFRLLQSDVHESIEA